MAIIARGTDDVFLDRAKAKLLAFASREKAISADADFDIELDKPTPWESDRSLVNLYIESDNNSDKAKSCDVDRSGTFTVVAECWAQKGSRLRYLKTQALTALFSLADNRDFGFDPNTIKVYWPDWTRIEFSPDTPRELLKSSFAGKWSFKVEYAFTPEELDHGILTNVHVDAGLWTGDYSISH